MTPEVRAFVENYSKKPKPKMSIAQFFKTHNHEIWKTCFDCGDHFDIRKELHHDQCPSCKSKNIK
ncbi:hypothetical protein [Chryseobacterium sp. YIM B08800]|uniref:hypothetical protein n=1 Tax=Chryseobacterium sp. YIM B08800 TaxID=2984136 RepID=UPI00223FB4AC|nr:hypothetical protein [Chryseobacterium sp. YIM B08800]